MTLLGSDRPRADMHIHRDVGMRCALCRQASIFIRFDRYQVNHCAVRDPLRISSASKCQLAHIRHGLYAFGSILS